MIEEAANMELADLLPIILNNPTKNLFVHSGLGTNWNAIIFCILARGKRYLVMACPV